jgi:hypothetical protein
LGLALGERGRPINLALLKILGFAIGGLVALRRLWASCQLSVLCPLPRTTAPGVRGGYSGERWLGRH